MFYTGGKQTYYKDMLKPLQYVCSTQGVNKRIIRTCNTGGKQTYYKDMLKPLQYVCSTQGVNKRIIRTC